MSLYIFPYKLASKSAKALADALGVKRIKPIGSNYIPNPIDIIINWGSKSEVLNTIPHVLNKPENVANASNKLTAFVTLNYANIKIPMYLEPSEFDQLQGLSDKFYVRTLLESHSGKGIVITNYDGLLALGDKAKLVTLPVVTTSEWRVHVFNGEVIFVQKKAKVAGTNPDPAIKTHDHGWIFKHMEVKPPKSMQDLAVNAVKALGLTFGAVDIGYNKETKISTVFEVNTAPGLEGETINAYATAITKFLEV